MTFVDVVLYLLKKEQKTPYRKMENQTLTTTDLQYILNVLDQQMTLLQMTCDKPFENQSYNNIKTIKERTMNSLVELHNKK